MARAKKTDRAEARRRARAVAASNEAAAVEGSDGGGTGPAKSTGGGGAAAGSAPEARPSITGAFREATRPVDLRGDIRRIPWLITRTPAVIVPSLLVIGAAVWYATSGTGSSLSSFAFQLLVYPPPQIGALFLAGILTDRMSYMAGGIVGLVCGIVFTLYLAFVPIPATVLQGTQVQAYMLYGLVLSPLSGLAIGGFAGFYRRFLRRANPNSGKRQPPKSKGSSKAPARR